MAEPTKPDQGSTFWMSVSLVLLLGPVGIGFAVAVFSLLEHVFRYLQTGQWAPISVIDALIFFHVEWAIEPRSWFGLHKLLDNLWLGFGTIIIGVCLSLLVLHIFQSIWPDEYGTPSGK